MELSGCSHVVRLRYTLVPKIVIPGSLGRKRTFEFKKNRSTHKRSAKVELLIGQ